MGQSEIMAKFAADHRENAFAHDFQIPRIDRLALEAGEHENPDPFVIENCRRVIFVIADKTCFQRKRAVFQSGGPFVFPAPQIDLLIDPVDQIVLGREVAEQKRLRNAQPARQLPRLAIEPDFGEVTDRAVDDLAFALRRRQTPAYRLFGG